MWKYPKTRAIKVREVIHGKTLIDNYRWLENKNNKEVQNWVVNQNKFTEKILKENSSTEVFLKELEKNFNTELFDIPIFRKNFYFWSERKAGKNQQIIFMKKG